VAEDRSVNVACYQPHPASLRCGMRRKTLWGPV
jgi:hypothetical protein